MRPSRRPNVRQSLLLPLLVLMTTTASAADVTGIWLGHDRDGHIEIKPCGKFLCGHIISILDRSLPSNPRDIYNENPDQRARPICGLRVLGELKNEGSSWGDGWVYDPRRGKSYSADIWLNDPNTLSVRGYIGMKIMSETKVWTRAGKDIDRCVQPRP
jgi:uncharacterized protein (DUF2147 family)